MSEDAGIHWTKPKAHPDLVTPVCQVCLLSLHLSASLCLSLPLSLSLSLARARSLSLCLSLFLSLSDLASVYQGSVTGFKESLYFAGPYSETARRNLTILGSDDNGVSSLSLSLSLSLCLSLSVSLFLSVCVCVCVCV
eukprot:COSAG03_NODE_7101_length_962_cov_24.990730_2_plen_137_part_01